MIADHWRLKVRRSIRDCILAARTDASERVYTERTDAVLVTPSKGVPDNLPAVCIYVPKSKSVRRGCGFRVTAEIHVEVWATGASDDEAGDARDRLCAQVEEALFRPNTEWAEPFEEIATFDDETTSEPGTRIVMTSTLKIAVAFTRDFRDDEPGAVLEGVDGVLDVVDADGPDGDVDDAFTADLEFIDP